MSPDEISLVETCSMFPEQYDAKDKDGNTLGYLRLRWGEFTVECPDVDGETVYRAEPDGDGFFFDEEREMYLDFAKRAIAEWWTRKEATDGKG